MRIPSNLPQFQPAADRSSEACRLITDAIQHRLPAADDLHVAPYEQVYAIVFDDGRSSVGRVPDLDGEDGAGAADAALSADFSAEALAADANSGTIAFATVVERTPIVGAKEFVTWVISSYVPEQFATATLLTFSYTDEKPVEPFAQTSRWWASEELPFEDAMDDMLAWTETAIEPLRQVVSHVAAVAAAGDDA